MPPENTPPPNGICKGHAGLMEAVDHIKITQYEREKTITRMWRAIECRISTKAFVSALSISIAVISLVIGVLFYNQDHLLSALMRSQENITEKMGDIKLDVEIIKQQLRQQTGSRCNDSGGGS